MSGNVKITSNVAKTVPSDSSSLTRVRRIMATNRPAPTNLVNAPNDAEQKIFVSQSVVNDYRLCGTIKTGLGFGGTCPDVSK
jgi:hypothetical protein